MNYFKHEQALVHDGAKIGRDTNIWAFCNISEGAIIGKNCNVCDGSYVEKGGVIGDNVTIKHHVSIFDGVTVEDNVFVGSNVAFINDRYPRSKAHAGQDVQWEKTTIKKGASLGANATILCGVTVGAYAFVGAGTVVTKDVPDYGLVYGNPAVLKGYVDEKGNKVDKDSA
ncbi:MAG: UDP-2-acetamido-3-amino-2,3-dideoxy-glucuronate N-acetyltransferase [Lysobacterales bacterium]|jgi:UDP-2-acetamido-3-amino-2,3-dideoxy-glucuronate N-acetyltransferase